MKVLVIGGGPAGMMAAGLAAESGAKVCLIDKNNTLGRKLRITGKGRCNITNACDHETLVANVLTNPRFLHSAFRGFSNHDLIAFMEENGLPCKIERGDRVFPECDSAPKVCDMLTRWLAAKGVRILQAKADKLFIKDGKIEGVRFGEKAMAADAVVLATGGASYPQTGSTGEGYFLAKRAGHTIILPRPSLVPLVCRERYDLMGLSLKNITLSVFDGEKCIYKELGEMLFTKDGISGPVVLRASAHMRNAGTYRAYIDLKPGLSEEQLDKRLLRDFEKYAKKDFLHALDDLLPKRLIDCIIRQSEIPPHKKTGLLSKSERQRIGNLLKSFPLTITGFRPLSEAIVTAGGVSTAEIDPKTMESKIVKGLYFAGEIIDVDAYTGGFNLQIAFSTGYAAGTAIGKKEAAELGK